MARHQERSEPVTEEEFAEMDRRIADHFDRVRELLAAELDED